MHKENIKPENPKQQTSNYLAVTKIEINLKILLCYRKMKGGYTKHNKQVLYIFIYFLSKFVITNIYKQVGKKHGRQLKTWPD